MEELSNLEQLYMAAGYDPENPLVQRLIRRGALPPGENFVQEFDSRIDEGKYSRRYGEIGPGKDFIPLRIAKFTTRSSK